MRNKKVKLTKGQQAYNASMMKTCDMFITGSLWVLLILVGSTVVVGSLLGSFDLVMNLIDKF